MYNGDSNANVKTQIGFDKYNNNFACAEHILVHFLYVTERLWRQAFRCDFLWRMYTRRPIFLLLSELGHSVNSISGGFGYTDDKLGEMECWLS